MDTISGSTFMQIEGRKHSAWNNRLIAAENKRNRTNANEVSKDYVEKFKVAVETGEIKLMPVERCWCGSKDLEIVSAFDRFGLDFSTHICKKCGLVRVAPFIDQASLKNYYETYYHPIHFGKVSLQDSSALFRKGQGLKVYNRVKGFIDHTAISVLEIGVGTGSVLCEFKEAAGADGHSVEELGTELNEECIKRAKQNGIQVIFGGIDEAIETRKKFDLVILSHVFEHFIDLNAELKKLKQVMTEKGIVYVEVPGLMTLHKKSEYQFDYIGYVTHAHVYNFNLTSLTHVFNCGGFELLSGNEEVEAVFRLGKQTVSITNNHERLLDYLLFLEQNKDYFFANHRAALEKAADLRRKEQLLEETEKKLAQKNAELLEKLGQLKQRDEQLRQTDQQIRALVNSTSWKITGPLRWTTKKLKDAFSTGSAEPGADQKLAVVAQPSAKAAVAAPFDLTPHRERMKGFKDRYKGKRCFIIGNGPSLNKIDLRVLKDEYTFGVNGIFYKHDEIGFKPTFYIVEDNHVVADNIERINNVDYSFKFFPVKYQPMLALDEKTTFFNMDWEFYWKSSPHYCKPRFSRDCANVIYAGQTVTYVNMQLAFYMGFTEVYLIGMDFSYSVPQSSEVEGCTIISQEDDPNHFHPDYFGKGKKWHDPKLENCLLSFQLAKQVYEKDGRKIFNATAGGKLELFERIDFEKLF